MKFLLKSMRTLLVFILVLSLLGIPVYAAEATTPSDEIPSDDIIDFSVISDKDLPVPLSNTKYEAEPNNYHSNSDNIFSGDYYIGSITKYDIDKYYFELEGTSTVYIDMISEAPGQLVGLYYYSDDDDCFAAFKADDYYDDYYIGSHTYTLGAGAYIISVINGDYYNFDYGIALEIDGPDYVEICEHPDGVGLSGGTATFSILAYGHNLKYQWEWRPVDGSTWSNTTFPGYNTDTLSVPVNINTTNRVFRCKVTNSKGNTSKSLGAILVLTTALEFVQQPATECISSGGYVDLVTKTAGAPVKSFQWQYSTNGGATWANTTLTGYDTNTLRVAVNNTTNGRMYRCVATANNGAEVISSEATIIKVDAPVFNTHPIDQTVEGGYAYFSVDAEGYCDYEEDDGLELPDCLTYQWQWSSNGTSWANTSLTGYNTDTLRVAANATTNGRYYRCVITDKFGASVTTTAAQLTVASKLAINAQPVDQTASSGYVYFSVGAEGDSLSYQWQWSSNGTSWANTSLTGYNTDTLRVAANATTNGRYYRCVVTDKNGQTLFSNAAQLLLK